MCAALRRPLFPQTWRQGDNTVQTLYNNNIDFYFSFQIGIAVAIAVVGVVQVVRGLRRARARRRNGRNDPSPETVPQGRGDMRGWVVFACYVVVTSIYIAVSVLLLMWHHGGWTSKG